MFKANYKETLIRIKQIIYDLAIEEGNSRQRLISVLTAHSFLDEEEFPPKLKNRWKTISFAVTNKGKDEPYGAIENTLRVKHKSTCSKIIRQIINLSIDLDIHINESN